MFMSKFDVVFEILWNLEFISKIRFKELGMFMSIQFYRISN